ncbi:septum formation family protein [Leifsonia sp. McL0607]|uniref:septum formation family protein n=1 Tax=Leifsonia sp. McL0607 TaxID=3415672 RepID=UPI003CE96A1B
MPFRPLGTLTPGDCLQTYTSKSADSYPVIDCGSPHIAQLLSKGELPQSSDAAYPGEEALDTQIGDLCGQHLDWDWVRVRNEDVQVDLRYADTAASWASGDRERRRLRLTHLELRCGPLRRGVRYPRPCDPSR